MCVQNDLLEIIRPSRCRPDVLFSPHRQALPSVVNAAILTSAWSAASSDLYTSSRTLYGLALQGNAPRWFAKTTSWGLPARACLLGIAFACLAYLSAGAGTAGKVFGWLANMCSCVTFFCSLFRAPAGFLHVTDDWACAKTEPQLVRPHCLVWNRHHLPPVLLRPQGAGHRPTRAPVQGASAAVSHDLLGLDDLPHPVLCQLHRVYQGPLGHGQLYHVLLGTFSSLPPLTPRFHG